MILFIKMYFHIGNTKIRLSFMLQKFEVVFHFVKNEEVFYLKMVLTTRLNLAMLQRKLSGFPA